MGIISCTPKKKLVCCHLSATVVFLIGIVSYAGYKFVGDGDNVPVMDDGCSTFGGLKGPEDITPYTDSLAFIGSDDRENWLIHENIEQTGVEQGKISLLRGLDKSINGEHSIDLVQDLLLDAGFPEGVDFHPHGMALTPDWVNKDDKKLFVINHAWNNGGERIEVFKVNKDAAEEIDDITSPGVLEWQYAMGDLDGLALKDSEWQKESYGRFNGLAVCGEDEVLLGKWIGPYILPGQEGYSADQLKNIDGKASVTYAASVVDEVGDRTTEFKTVADGFTLSKSIAFNNDGSEVFVSDTINQVIHSYTWDKEAKTLTKTESPSVFVTKGRMDNMKPIEGTNHIMGGNIESFSGNIAFELQRKTQSWDNATNVPECIGGAEEYRRNDEGVMESRYQAVSSKINGWSNGAKVGANVVCGSWIDKNFLVCPYDDSIEWTPLKEPSGPGLMIVFVCVVIGSQFALFVTQWKKLSEKDYFENSN